MKTKVYIIDFSSMTKKEEIQLIIKNSLDFPEYYGKTWISFSCCFHDIIDRSIHVVVIGKTMLRKNYKKEYKRLNKILKYFSENFNGRNIITYNFIR